MFHRFSVPPFLFDSVNPSCKRPTNKILFFVCLFLKFWNMGFWFIFSIEKWFESYLSLWYKFVRINSFMDSPRSKSFGQTEINWDKYIFFSPLCSSYMFDSIFYYHEILIFIILSSVCVLNNLFKEVIVWYLTVYFGGFVLNFFIVRYNCNLEE